MSAAEEITRRFVAAKDSGLTAADAAIVGPELLRLCRNEPERLKPAAVVAAAADFRSPLRRFFQWDNLAAADAFRQAQAERLMRAVQIQVVDARGEPGPARPLFIQFAPRPAPAPGPPAEEAEGDTQPPIPNRQPARPARAVALRIVTGRSGALPARTLAAARKATLRDLRLVTTRWDERLGGLSEADQAQLIEEFWVAVEAAQRCLADAERR